METTLPDIKPRHVSVSDYLDLEWAAAHAGGRKREYIDGKVREMAGANWQHNLIAGNLAGALVPRLKGQPLAVFGSEMRVRCASAGPFYYPDLTVAPVPPQILRDRGGLAAQPGDGV